MEKTSDTPIPVTEYKGQGKWSAAVQSLVAWAAGTELLTATLVGGFLKEKGTFGEGFRNYFKYEGALGKMNIAGASLIGGFAAVSAYSRADKAQQKHDQLMADNVGMRSQLNQTGQILQHVAAEVEKGKLADR